MEFIIAAIIGVPLLLWTLFVFIKTPSRIPPASREPPPPADEEEIYREYFTALYDQELDRITTLDQIHQLIAERRNRKDQLP